MKSTDIELTSFDFIIDSLGFNSTPIEQRAIVMCKILKELSIPFKKYYHYGRHKYLRSKVNKKEPYVNIIIIGACTEDYGKYAIYLYKQKMIIIEKLNAML